jgi:hypothetical protein
MFLFDRGRMKRRGERHCIVLISMRFDLDLYRGLYVSLDLFTYLENLRGRVIPLDLVWDGIGFAAVFSD